MNWNEQGYFAALDWASDHHDVVVINQQAQIERTLRFAHSAAGWAELQAALKPYPSLPLAVETSSGCVVEQLLALDVRIYPVNPKSAERYRERHAPAGVKDDARDAWTLAAALRMDGGGWRALTLLDPIVAELRMLCRDEVALIEQRTAFVNQLRQALREYYPVALEAFEDWTSPASWALVEAFPTPQLLVKAGRRKWTAFLHAHKLWRPATAEKRLALFAQANTFTGTAPTVAAKSLLAVSLARTLRTLETQLLAYRARIEEAFGRHPDHDLFGSLPGVGSKLAPRLLSEIGDDRSRFSDPQALQTYAGTAPVTIQSGKTRFQRIRRACDLNLRASVHLWADLSRHRCVWAQTYYLAHRQRGQTHACAIRCLGQRWLKILWRMWQNHALYDEAIHTRNQTAHASWTLTLQAQPR